jgi:hypothetical protein
LSTEKGGKSVLLDSRSAILFPMFRPLMLWYAFLLVWSGSLIWIGGVSEASLPAVAAAFPSSTSPRSCC